jgi:6-phosphofructokinase 1
MLRGGSPSAYDRILATKFGVHAAQLIKDENYGRTVAMVKGKITSNKLNDIAGLTKFVQPDDQLVITAKDIGVSFGE